MDNAIKNTLNEIALWIQVARKPVKEIAAECGHYEKQIGDEEAKALFAALAACKTRKQMKIVLGL